jgi:hypothetical protein
MPPLEIEISPDQEHPFVSRFHDIDGGSTSETSMGSGNPAVRQLPIVGEDDSKGFMNGQQVPYPVQQIDTVSEGSSVAVTVNGGPGVTGVAQKRCLIGKGQIPMLEQLCHHLGESFAILP